MQSLHFFFFPSLHFFPSPLIQAVYSPTNVSISCEIISNPILPQRNISWEIHSTSFGLYSKLGHGAYSMLGAAVAQSHLILNRTVFHQGLNYVLVLKILGKVLGERCARDPGAAMVENVGSEWLCVRINQDYRSFF